MPTSYILLLLIAAAVAAYFVGVQVAQARFRLAPAGVKMHSRTSYSGGYLAIWTLLPALVALIGWASISPTMIQRGVYSHLPDSVKSLPAGQRSLIVSRIGDIADGIAKLSGDERKQIERSRLGLATMEDAKQLLQSRGVALGSAPEPYLITAAYDQMQYRRWSDFGLAALVSILAIAGFGFAYMRIHPRLRTRNTVERVILWLLIAASGVAILTTVGIIWSMLFETIHFFQRVSPFDFFFGTVWDPRFSAAGREGGDAGQFGILPLAWGTLFISIVALLVAVPIGLFAAIYMSEYATKRVRDIAKPVLEILAGIPTIVYGFFALVTFGPFLRDSGATVGLPISANSVLTAGIVMGVMIIPFVSSLSDDIINAVPQSLREGSYGLGATKSETIKQVILPAALPGIVGAVLLAASRAIGETMIVVLAAGIAANLTLNPGEPVTTITVKIVSQLTGDLEFDSPQTLVAFALGLTLFVVTLGLNIYALYIVRKYKEQYD
ncbi:MAG: phosphate ABC transporter permease subunit PstC [Beijerinckiaceae bacterium]